MEYISRGAAIDALCKTCPLKGAECLETEECAPFKHIQAIPAADVQPMEKAHWEHRTPGGWVDHYATCSNCGKRMALDEWDNFCPNCGADMRER